MTSAPLGLGGTMGGPLRIRRGWRRNSSNVLWGSFSVLESFGGKEMWNISNMGREHCAWGKICAFTDLSGTWRTLSLTQSQRSNILCRISSSQPGLGLVCNRHTWSYSSIHHSFFFFFFAASFEGLKVSPQVLLGNETQNQNSNQSLKMILRWFSFQERKLCVGKKLWKEFLVAIS